jgi:hypothetical protein
MLGHVELPGMGVEHVVDESCGEVEKELAPERFHGSFDVHAIPQDTIENQFADLVVVMGPGENTLRAVPEGFAAAASGSILTTGDLEEGDSLVGDRACLSGDRPLPMTELAALRTGRLLGSAMNRYNNRGGDIRAHACVLGG